MIVAYFSLLVLSWYRANRARPYV